MTAPTQAPPSTAEIEAALKEADAMLSQRRSAGHRRQAAKEIETREVSLSDLRKDAGELCARAAEGVTVYITNHGRRIAKLVALERPQTLTYNPRPKPREESPT